MVFLVIIFAVAAGAFGFLWFRERQSNADPKNTVTKGILNKGGVGPVLAVTNDNQVLFYNKEFVQLFPEIINSDSISAYPEMVRLFTDEEYVSEVLSKIYEIRQESIEGDKADGKFVWLVDVTGHYKTNKKLTELKEMADAANKAKSNFLANMSHEIRTPINTVLGMDEIILREATDVQIKGYAENIRDAGTTLLSLVNDLLDFCLGHSHLLHDKETFSVLITLRNLLVINNHHGTENEKHA